MKNLSPRFRAFTLIELLIVITIIGILAVALIPRLTGGPARARDGQRKTDLQQIATALEFYADDNGGEYPSTNGCVSAVDLSSYLTTEVDDPQASAAGACTTGYGYTGYNDSGSTYTGYVLTAALENPEASGDGIYNSFTPTASSNYTDDVTDATTGQTLCEDMTTTCTPVYVVGR